MEVIKEIGIENGPTEVSKSEDQDVDVDGSDDGDAREERGCNGKEARVVVCLLRLLGRWTELQVERAMKNG